MTKFNNRAYQDKLINDSLQAWADGNKVIMAVLPTGGGKCLGRGTPVLMYDGRVLPVEQVVVGDLLMGPDSTPRVVQSLATGSEQLYKVTPVKGDPYVVNESHILSLKRTSTYAGDPRRGEIVNVGVLDYVNAAPNFRHMHKGWRTGVDFAKGDDLPMSPYILGAWLGDGTEKRSVCLTNTDDEVIAEWSKWGESLGCTLSVRTQKTTTCNMYYLTGDGSKGGNPALNLLREVGVFGNRHIPLSYLTASRADRLQLLAGIVDTDGSLGHCAYDLIFKSERLARDIAYLARSLGFACYVRAARKVCTNTGASGIYHRLSISGDVCEIPCKVPRRKATVRKQVKNHLVTGLRVEPIGVGEYFGFEIDGDRLFMLGDFTVTHNTVCMSSIIKQHEGYGVAMVHRGELVSQISITLARSGIVHSVAGSRATITAITAQHYALFGRSYVNQQSADWIVASVDTVVSGKGVWVDRFKRSTLGIIDEGHHCLKDNKWGRCFSMLAPDSKGWLPTATPRRSDGKGLGSHSDGIADVLVEGPDMRALIDQGYLTDYTVRVIDTNDLDLSNVKTTASGELSKVGVAEAVAKSRVIVGNVVEKYLQFAKGKLGVTFAATIEEGERLTAEFNAQGVPAVMLTGDTPTAERAREIASFSRREKLMLVNVDLFGEGFDLPAIEIVIMARPTASFILYTQQFGRALRLLIDPELMRQWDTFTVEERLAHIAACDKPRAIIHDHVGNFIRHGGPPDMPQQWTLDPIKKGASAPSDAVPMTACAGCYMPFEKFFKVCPFCAVPVPPPTPSQRTQPETVDGDIFEVSAEELAKLRAGVVDVFALARIPHDLQNTPTAARLTRLNAEKITNHRELMDTISLWAGRYIGEDNSVIARRFYHTFGVDVLTAAGMNARDADTLKTKILEVIQK